MTRWTWGWARFTSNARNNSPVLSARTFIQGKPKVWTTGERDEKKARAAATQQFFDLHRRIAAGEHLHGHLLTEAVDKFLEYADSRLTREVSAGQREQYHFKAKVLRRTLKEHFERDGHSVRIADVTKDFLLRLERSRREHVTISFLVRRLILAIEEAKRAV